MKLTRLLPILAVLLRRDRRTARFAASNYTNTGNLTGYTSDQIILPGTFVTLDETQPGSCKLRPAKPGVVADPAADPPVLAQAPDKIIGFSANGNCNVAGNVDPQEPLLVMLLALTDSTLEVQIDPASADVTQCASLYLSCWEATDDDGNPVFNADGSPVLVSGATASPVDPTNQPIIGLSINPETCPGGGRAAFVGPSASQIAEACKIKGIVIDSTLYDGTQTSIPLPVGCAKPAFVVLGGNVLTEGVDYDCNGAQLDILNSTPWNSANDFPLTFFCYSA